MAAVKHTYEFVLAVSVKLGEKSEEIIEKFKNLIESNAQLTDVSRWGKKKFAYPVNKETEGEYVLFVFESSPEFPSELDRISQITDGVLRSLITRKPA